MIVYLDSKMLGRKMSKSKRYETLSLYRGCQKRCTHILKDIIYVLLFEVELNYGKFFFLS